jgi:hypothetical protein
MFAVLLDFFCFLACFWHADHQLESEPPVNFQDIDFKNIEQQQAGFEGKFS